MILTAHQPVYLPWLGLFHKIAIAEKFCVFDIAQYQTKDFNNRNKIKTTNGPLWLTVPVESKNHFEKKIKDIKIINNGWNSSHFKAIELAYRRAPFYGSYVNELEKILLVDRHTYLADLNLAILNFCMKSLNLDLPIVFASDFSFEGKKSDLVLDMCNKLGASDYIFGEMGKDYADVDSFCAAGVTPYFQKYVHPTYPQLHGKFEPYMSVIDLLFNMGEKSIDVLMSGNVIELETVKMTGEIKQ